MRSFAEYYIEVNLPVYEHLHDVHICVSYVSRKIEFINETVVGTLQLIVLLIKSLKQNFLKNRRIK